MSSFQIKSYAVNISNCSTPYAYIMLYDAESAAKATFKARLDFTQLPEDNSYSMTQSGNAISANMNFKALPSVIDLLRNEKPLSLNWTTSNKICVVSTSEEPVGEGEV